MVALASTPVFASAFLFCLETLHATGVWAYLTMLHATYEGYSGFVAMLMQAGE